MDWQDKRSKSLLDAMADAIAECEQIPARHFNRSEDTDALDKLIWLIRKGREDLISDPLRIFYVSHEVREGYLKIGLGRLHRWKDEETDFLPKVFFLYGMCSDIARPSSGRD